MKTQPTLSRTVHYILTGEDAEKINRRRTDGPSIADRMKNNMWPAGAQAHIGNPVKEGDHVTMTITAIWPDTINGQCTLDGTDTYWVTSAKKGTEPGTWHWIEGTREANETE